MSYFSIFNKFQARPQKRQDAAKPEVKSADLLKSPFDIAKHEDTSRDWNQQTPTIDTWTNETANTVPGNNNGSTTPAASFNNRPASGFNRRQQSGNGNVGSGRNLNSTGNTKYSGSGGNSREGYRNNSSQPARNGYSVNICSDRFMK